VASCFTISPRTGGGGVNQVTTAVIFGSVGGVWAKECRKPDDNVYHLFFDLNCLE